MFWLSLGAFNVLVWLPFIWNGAYSFGNGPDSQIYIPAIHALLRESNGLWDPVLRLFEARTDVFSFPYFGVLYPFYWTVGIETQFAYKQHLVLDNLSVLFHQTTASVLFALLLRRMGCRALLASLGGIAYAYSLYLKDWSSWLWALSGYTWIPLCLMGIWLIVVEQKPRGGILCLAVGTGLIALGTALPLAYAIVLMGTFMIASMLYARCGWRAALRSWGAICIGGVIGALLSATHVLPVLVRSNEYIRWFSGGAVVGGFKPPYEATLVSTLDSWGPFHLLIPFAQPGGLGNAFLGVGIVFFAGYLLLRSPEWKAFAWVMVVASVYFLLDAMGELTPIHRLTYQLPLLGSVRYPIANVVVTLVCLLIIGFLGAETMCRHLEQRRDLRVVGLALLIFSVSIGVSAFLLRDEFSTLFKAGTNHQIFWFSLIAAIFVAVALTLSKRFSLLGGLPILLLLSAFPMNTFLAHPKILRPATEYLTCDDFSEFQSAVRDWHAQTHADSRLAVWWETEEKSETCLNERKTSSMLLESIAMSMGWNVRLPYVSPRPVHEFNIFQRLTSDSRLTMHENLLQAGITHVISNIPEIRIPNFYQKIEKRGLFTFYAIENGAMGLDAAGCLLANDNGIWIANQNGKRRIDLSAGDRKRWLPVFACVESESTRIGLELSKTRSRSGSNISYQIETSDPVLLVLDRVITPNWRILVNGKPLSSVIVVDGYRIGVPVMTGSHNLVFQYRPWDFLAGVWLMLFGMVMFVVTMLYRRPQRGRPDAAQC